LIAVPLFLPVLPMLGIDAIWFGVFVVLLAEIGMVTPPLGVLVFAMHNIARTQAPTSAMTAARGRRTFAA
jgi:C4-dicarboxylate transporter, DctM subunit